LQNSGAVIMKTTQAMKYKNATSMKRLQIKARKRRSFPSPLQRLSQKANSELKHCFRCNAVLDKGLEVRLVDDTYVVCKDGNMIIPKPLQRCAVLWYHHYLQHPGHTRLEETMKATMYWKGMCTIIRYSGPSLDQSRPHFHTIHVFLPKRPPLSFHQSHPPRLPSALLHSTIECFRGRQRWWMAKGGGGGNGGRGARWQRQRDKRKRGGDATTSRRQRGATRDARLDERTREGRLDERGAVQCERPWHDERGGNVTTSRHEQGVAQ
jgi:hypothetical protein